MRVTPPLRRADLGIPLQKPLLMAGALSSALGWPRYIHGYSRNGSHRSSPFARLPLDFALSIITDVGGAAAEITVI